MVRKNSMETNDKKAAWIDALHRKLEMRTQEEWDYETMSEEIYKDDILEFYRECQEDYVLENVRDRRSGVEAWLDYFLNDDFDLGEAINVDSLRGISFVDYMSTKGFPITFKTWPNDTVRTMMRK